jgi:hypothetical protein
MKTSNRAHQSPEGGAWHHYKRISCLVFDAASKTLI